MISNSSDNSYKPNYSTLLCSGRYLHKKDAYYNRIVPDWDLQIKTVEQQYLYQGEFALLIKELTDEGAVVQDVTTGVFGFLPQERCRRERC